MIFTVKPRSTEEVPVYVYLEMRSGDVCIRVMDKNGDSWGLAKLTQLGHLQLNRSVPSILGFRVDKNDGSIITVKE